MGCSRSRVLASDRGVGIDRVAQGITPTGFDSSRKLLDLQRQEASAGIESHQAIE